MDDENTDENLDDTTTDEEEMNDNITHRFTLEELTIQLQEALENEDYEIASKIRDEINRRQSN